MGKRYPLSYVQKLSLREQLYDINSPHMNIGGYSLAHGKMNPEIYKKAVQKVCADNDILRTIFVRNQDGDYFQEVVDSCPEVIVRDFSEMPNSDEYCLFWMQKKISSPFKLVGEKMCEFGIIFSDENSYCYSIYHHLIADGWSIALVANQIAENYLKLNSGENLETKANVSYFDFLEQEKLNLSSKKFKESVNYWKNLASEISEYNWQLASKKKKIQVSSATATFIEFKSKEYGQIMKYCKENNVSIFHFFIVIFLLLIRRNSKEEKILINVMLQNRKNYRQKCSLGCFSNTAPITLNMEETNFVTLLRDCERVVKEVYRHQSFSREFYSNVLANNIDLSGSMVFSYEPHSHQYLMGGFSSQAYNLHSHRIINAVDVHLMEFQKENKVVLGMYFDENIFSKAEISIYKELVRLFVNQIVDEEITDVKKLQILTKTEKNILNSINNTDKILLKDTLCSVLDDVFYKYRMDTAVIFQNKPYSYKELHDSSLKVAYFLQKNQIKKGDRIAVCIDYSFEMVAIMTGIFMYGAVFVPFSKKEPISRLTKMSYECEAKMIILDKKVEKLPVQALVEDIFLLDKFKLEAFPQVYQKADCYIVFTSGSTGEPKGVISTHLGVVNVLEEWEEKYKFEGNKIILLHTSSFGHDVFIGNYLKTIATGGVLVLPTEEELCDLNKLTSFIALNKVNTLDSTPTVINTILDYCEKTKVDDSSLKCIILGSDVCPLEIYQKLWERYKDKAKIINSYGVSEATIYSTDFCANTIDDIPEFGNMPIGRPFRNTKIYVLDDEFNDVNLGREGELFISGYGLAKGYTSEKLTKEKFLKLENIGNVYRTGDIVKLRFDGQLEFVGRKDFQIKIKGHRIEPFEVEHCLRGIKEINDVVVVVNEVGENDVLVAYYTSKEEIQSEKIIREIKNVLPEYMMPKFFIRITEIPVSMNGKVDRKSLMSRKIKERIAGCDTQLPMSLDKSKVEQIWRGVLGNRFSKTESFSEMGGDSLEAVRIASELNFEEFKCSYLDIYKSFSFEDFYNAFIIREKINDLDVANRALELRFGKGISIKLVHNSKISKKSVYLALDKEYMDIAQIVEFCSDRFDIEIQPQYILGKKYKDIDSVVAKSLLGKLSLLEKDFFQSMLNNKKDYLIEDAMYSSVFRICYRNVYFVSSLRIENNSIQELQKAVSELMDKNELLRACLVKIGFDKYAWKIFKNSLYFIPVIDLSEYDAVSVRDFMYNVLSSYYAKKNDFRKFMFRAIIVKVNMSEALLWYFMDDSIHDDYGSQLIYKYLLDVTKNGYKEYLAGVSYSNYLEEVRVRHNGELVKEMIEELNLNEINFYIKEYAKFIKTKIKNKHDYFSFGYKHEFKNKVKKEEFHLAFASLFVFLKQTFPFLKIPIVFFHNTRFFSPSFFSGVIGDLIDEVPILLDTSLTIEENIKDVQQKLSYINNNKISFKNILLNKDTRNKALYKLAKEATGNISNTYRLLLFNFKQGDIRMDELVTEKTDTVNLWLNGISFNVSIYNDCCEIVMKSPYKLDEKGINCKLDEYFKDLDKQEEN